MPLEPDLGFLLASSAKADTSPFGSLTPGPSSFPDEIPFELRNAGKNGSSFRRE
jgi:hypothetical protein